jgi:hypothetical protein
VSKEPCAVEVHRNIKQMFRWAEKRQPWRRLLLDGNPAELVEIAKVVDPDDDLSNIRSRVLSDDEVRELRDRFGAMVRDHEASDDRRSAVRPVEPETKQRCGIACPHCAASVTADDQWLFEAGTWFVPKENVKGSRGKRRDHYVHLSRFALRQFRALQARTGMARRRAGASQAATVSPTWV